MRDDPIRAARCAEEALQHHQGCAAAIALLADVNAAAGRDQAAAAWSEEARAVGRRAAAAAGGEPSG